MTGPVTRKAASPSRFDRMVDRLIDIDGEGYGDERERSVLLEANAVGLTVGILASLAAGLVLALLGYLLAPFLLVLLAVLPAGLAATHYARRRHVDPMELADRAGARSTRVLTVVLGAAVVLIFAAMAVTVFSGDPVISVPLDRPRSGFMGGLVQGGVVGGLLGGLATIVGGLVSVARGRRAS